MKVVLGITGSIAAYKSLELIRMLKKNGHEVRAVLTESARNFVTPLCCQTLSENEAYAEQFVLTKGMKHLALAEWGDVMVIAPATANILAKAALGIGDDLLSTALLSFRKPIVFVPAMDEGMWLNAAVRRNVRILLASGITIMEPAVGRLASGKIGKGRFPSLEMIYRQILSTACRLYGLSGRKFLITGGRTEEDIDNVRVVTNRASGKMAMEFYYAVVCRGGSARLIMGNPGVESAEDIDMVRVRTSSEMRYMLKRSLPWSDYLIMAAAVGDYRPAKKKANKVHSCSLSLSLVRNNDLLKELAPFKKGKIYVGFSLEDRDVLHRAKNKLKAKGLDMIVMNSASAIGSDRTSARILTRDGKVTNCGTLSKWDLSNRIIDLCVGKGEH